MNNKPLKFTPIHLTLDIRNGDPDEIKNLMDYIFARKIVNTGKVHARLEDLNGSVANMRLEDM